MSRWRRQQKRRARRAREEVAQQEANLAASALTNTGIEIIGIDGSTRPLSKLEFDAMGAAIDKNTAIQQDAPAEHQGDGWEGSIYGACPLQGDGTVDGLEWYFRARGSSWSFEVSVSFDPNQDWAGSSQYWATEGTFGEPGSYDASWMPFSTAWAIIEDSVRVYRADKARASSPAALVPIEPPP